MNQIQTHRIDLTATLCSVGSLLCWSIGPIFIKYLTGYFDSWSQNFFRYLVACLFWIPGLIIDYRRKTFDSSLWRKALAPAAINVIMQSFWAASFYYINPAFMTLLSKSSIVWIIGFSLVVFPQERRLIRSKRFLAGLALSLLGLMSVILFKRDFAVEGTPRGIALGLAAAFSWALYSISVRAAFKNVNSRQGFCVISIYTVIGLAIAAALFARPWRFLPATPWPWTCILISGITGVALSHVLYYAAMKRIGVTIPALVLLATPFSVLAVSSVVFDESLTGIQWFGGLVLVAGSAISILAQQSLRRAVAR